MWRTWQSIAKDRYGGMLLAVVFIISFFASLFFASAGMDMAAGDVGCPFMLHKETLCSMGALDHVGMWESSFTAVMPVLILLLFASILLTVCCMPRPHFLDLRRLAAYYFPRAYFERVLEFPYRPLQEMFSSGILHPKLF